MKICISVYADNSISVAAVGAGGIPRPDGAVKQYIYISEGQYEDLIDISDTSSVPAKSNAKAPERTLTNENTNPEDEFECRVDHGTDKIKQTLMVLREVWKNRLEISDVGTNITRSIKTVSDKLDRKLSTVYDKITRQNYISMPEFRGLVSEWLEKGSFENLQRFLKQSINNSRRPSSHDLWELSQFEKFLS